MQCGARPRSLHRGDRRVEILDAHDDAPVDIVTIVAIGVGSGARVPTGRRVPVGTRSVGSRCRLTFPIMPVGCDSHLRIRGIMRAHGESSALCCQVALNVEPR